MTSLSAAGIPSGAPDARGSGPSAQDAAETLAETLAETMTRHAAAVQHALDRLIAPVPGGERRLVEAMRYAVLNGGKRLRGVLAIEVAGLFGGEHASGAVRVGAAVEMLHAYSLVHDDLPCMDDDDLRRGQPSTHRKFDEATAVLAGDALQCEAFAVLADPDTHPDPARRVALVAALAAAAGAAGMVGGQMIDMDGEGRALPLSEVERLHALKTGRLIRFAAEAGAILAGADPGAREAVAGYGRDLGAAFQVADDVLDATESAEQLGKTAGKDAEAGKSTFVALLGVDGARNEARRLSDRAIGQLARFGTEADRLRELARWVVERKS